MDGNNTALILDLDPPLPLSLGVTTVRSSSCNEGTGLDLRESARAPGPAPPPRARRCRTPAAAGPRAAKRVRPLPRAGAGAGPPPRAIGGPRPRPAPTGRRGASRAAWRRGRPGPGPPPLAPGSQRLGQEPAPPRCAPGPGRSCRRRDKPDRKGSLLPRLVPYFFLTRSENPFLPSPAQFAFAPKRRTEKLGEEGGGFSFAGTESVEGGTGVAGRRQGRGVIAPGRKPGPGARSGLWVPVCPQKLLLSAFHRRPKQKPRSRWDTVSGTGLEGRLSLASGKVNLGLRAQDVLKF